MYCPKYLRSVYEKPAGIFHDSKKDATRWGAISFDKAFSSYVYLSGSFLKDSNSNLDTQDLTPSTFSQCVATSGARIYINVCELFLAAST
jgi:hypothetical protein